MELDPSAFIGAIFGILAVAVLYRALESIIRYEQGASAAAILSIVAYGNGVLIALQVSPIGTIAHTLAETSALIPPAYASFIDGILAIGTVVHLLVGLHHVTEKAGLFGLLAFPVALVSGYLVLTAPPLGIILSMVTMGFVLLSPITT